MSYVAYASAHASRAPRQFNWGLLVALIANFGIWAGLIAIALRFF